MTTTTRITYTEDTPATVTTSSGDTDAVFVEDTVVSIVKEGSPALAIGLDELGAPTGPVDFAGEQATSLCVENRTTDPGAPAVGQLWIRPDL